MGRSGTLASLCLAAACGGAIRPAAPAVGLLLEQPADESMVALITAAMVADARLEPAAPLYADDAVTIANGELRPLPPRYAGLAPAGEVAIVSTRIEVRERTAWAVVEYRWVSTAEGTAREGVASFVLIPAEAGGVGWRIRHAHSSSPPPE